MAAGQVTTLELRLIKKSHSSAVKGRGAESFFAVLNKILSLLPVTVDPRLITEIVVSGRKGLVY